MKVRALVKIVCLLPQRKRGGLGGARGGRDIFTVNWIVFARYEIPDRNNLGELRYDRVWDGAQAKQRQMEGCVFVV